MVLAQCRLAPVVVLVWIRMPLEHRVAYELLAAQLFIYLVTFYDRIKHLMLNINDPQNLGTDTRYTEIEIIVYREIKERVGKIQRERVTEKAISNVLYTRIKWNLNSFKLKFWRYVFAIGWDIQSLDTYVCTLKRGWLLSAPKTV